MNRILAWIRQIAGMPDYQRYLAHRRESHPADPTLTEREFYERFVSARYDRAGSRCC
jgi:uncharacterized short protein YbdD (DUF466 family)